MGIFAKHVSSQALLGPLVSRSHKSEAPVNENAGGTPAFPGCTVPRIAPGDVSAKALRWGEGIYEQHTSFGMSRW